MPRQITVRELQSLRETGAPIVLIDVRQGWEHETCALPDSLLLPLDELRERWAEAEPATAGALIVAYCHHGVRSLGAASILEAHGLGPVVSLAGGIDAWSREIDPAVPRY